MNETGNFNLYHDFAEKLSASKKSVEVDELLRRSYEEGIKITNELKSKKDQHIYQTSTSIFLSVCLVVFLLQCIFSKILIGIIGLVLLAIFVVVSKVLLTSQLKLVTGIQMDKEQGKLLDQSYINELKTYNLEIIRLKSIRFWLLMIMTSVLTPLILISLHYLLIGPPAVYLYGIAFLLGGFTWMIYFHPHIEQYKKLKEETLKI